MPIIKKAAPVIVKFAKKKSVQKGLKKIGKKAIKSATNSVGDMIEGKNPKERLKKDLVKIAKITTNTVLGNEPNGNGKKKSRANKRKHTTSIFRKGSVKSKKYSVFDA